MLTMLRQAQQPADPALVFVHGILSDANSCWRNCTGAAWPEIVKTDPSFPVCGIYTCTYPSSISGNLFSITDAADKLWEELRSSNLIAPTQRLVFVCHSMGGIVARRMLVKRQVELAQAGVKTVGLVLVASPSMGSRWATRLLPLSWLLGHAQAMALSSKESNQWLGDLRQDFINLRANGMVQVIGKELIEDRPLRLMRWAWLSPIVLSKEGAVFFPDSVKIGDSDHFSIAKPKDANAQQHASLRLFVQDFKQRSANGFSKIPAGFSFKDAVRCAGRPWKLDVNFHGFTQDELDVTLTIDREIQASDAKELLEKLRSAFPAGQIRDYVVAIDGTTATLTIA